MKRALEAGFIPLVDAAPLIVAAERGFAAREGLELRLVRQSSWACLRDHLNLGYFDCAHALAPLPIAAAIGVGQVRSGIVAPFVLSRGGNAITLSAALAGEVRSANAGSDLSGAGAWARALKISIRNRDDPITLAMVYPFSGHNFELRYWLASAGIHPDRAVRIVGIPPQLMVDSMRAQQIDGFCVGEPWNSLAAARGFGEIVATKSQIFPRGVEKVLAMSADLLADEDASFPLLRAVGAASEWCDRAENHAVLAELLARPEYLDLDPELIAGSISGSLPSAVGAPDPEFLYFHRHDANRPRREEALWVAAQMRRWGQIPADDTGLELAASVYRPDTYARVFGKNGNAPSPIAACDRIDFDGMSVAAYLQYFDLATPYGSVPG